MCSAIHHPGGQITNADGDLINNPGVPIGQMHNLRLKHLPYFKQYMCVTSRPFTANFATLARLRAAYEYKRQSDQKIEDGNPSLPDKFTTAKKAREHLEDMETWINK